MFKKMKQAEYHARTACRGSDITIDRSDDIKPFQGTLQGNVEGSIAWVATNTPMVAVQRGKGFGVKFIAAISKVSGCLVGFFGR